MCFDLFRNGVAGDKVGFKIRNVAVGRPHDGDFGAFDEGKGPPPEFGPEGQRPLEPRDDRRREPPDRRGPRDDRKRQPPPKPDDGEPWLPPPSGNR